MNHVTRRNFISGIGASVLAQYMTSPLYAQSWMNHESLDNVDCGVASGEPTSDSVILWTRMPPAGRSTSSSTEVAWEIAASETFSPDSLVQSGVVKSLASKDWTVKLRVQGLNPYTYYWYRFRGANGWASDVGRTKTLPLPTSPLDKVQFAFVSCQDYARGFYNVYEQLASDQVDFIVHLGDAIYAEGHERFHEGAIRNDLIGNGNAESLADYRAKYLLYLSDWCWREVRRLFPLFVIHDDHELWNNFPNNARSQPARISAAMTAYSEYSPNTMDLDDAGISLTWRSIKLGALAELFAMDLRSARTSIPCEADSASWGCKDTWGSDRSMLGHAQRSWLLNGMASSSAPWKILLSELMMMPYRIKATSWLTSEVLAGVFGSSPNSYRDVLISGDSWDGYPVERQQIMQFIYDQKIQGVVSLAGDVHNFFAGSLHLDPLDARSPIVAHEVVGGAVSSRSVEDILGQTVANMVNATLRYNNPHLQFMDLKYHGYTRVTITPAQMTSEFVGVTTVNSRSFQTLKLGAAVVANGQMVTPSLR